MSAIRGVIMRSGIYIISENASAQEALDTMFNQNVINNKEENCTIQWREEKEKIVSSHLRTLHVREIFVSIYKPTSSYSK